MLLAFITESIGFGEWFVLLAVVLIVMGPKRLPGTARKLGEYYAKFKRASEAFRRELLDMDRQISAFESDVASAADGADGEETSGEDETPAGEEQPDWDGPQPTEDESGDAGGGDAFEETPEDSAAGEPAEKDTGASA